MATVLGVSLILVLVNALFVAAEFALIASPKPTLEQRAGASGLPLSAMVKDDERCIRCGLCAVRCPTDAMTMEKFQITERYARPEEPA